MKRKAPRKKKIEPRCVCCQSSKEEFERRIEQLVCATLKHLALTLRSKKDREELARLLEVGLDRLLEIDEPPPTIDSKRV